MERETGRTKGNDRQDRGKGDNDRDILRREVCCMRDRERGGQR